MKKLKLWIVVSLVGWTLLYLGFSFAAWELNPGLWHPASRKAAAILGVLSPVFVFITIFLHSDANESNVDADQKITIAKHAANDSTGIQ
jgi:uncharacterized membrane protein